MLAGCSSKQEREISKIENLAQILAKTAEISQQYTTKKITLEELNKLTNDLQTKYQELVNSADTDQIDEMLKMQNDIENSFDKITTQIKTDSIHI